MRSDLFKRNYFFILAVDTLLLSAALYGSYLLRFNFKIPEESAGLLKSVLPFVIIIKMVSYYFFDLYRGMWRYTSLRDLVDVIKATSLSSLIIVTAVLFTHHFVGFVRSVFIIDWILTIFFISGCRLSIRLYFRFWSGGGIKPKSILKLLKIGSKERKEDKNLLIIGAGNCGEKICREIRTNSGLCYNVVGFIDNDIKKIGKHIHGIPVVGTTSEIELLTEKMKAQEVLIAIPSANGRQMRSIVAICEKIGLPYKTVPGMGELIDGKVSVRAIRDVAYQDLLGREVVQLEEGCIRSYLENARILITGAGGSIGSELCRQICRFRPASVILYDRAESPLYEIDLELKENFPATSIIPLLADIQDKKQLSKAFETYRPQVVFHAAAYKHVPMMELQSWNAVKNNIIGTRNVVDMSNRYNIERFVFVSTDKAVRPTNMMGATKRVAEMIVQGQNVCKLSNTPFVIVRFGNVVGSVGSVVPLFKKQIEKGGPVTVTDPEVTRFFMTIPEACQLILQAGAMGEGGEVFVLDMGTPVKIADMARDLIRLSGLEPDVDINVEYIGLRPGEKLYEELITNGEGVLPTKHRKIMVLSGDGCDHIRLNGNIDELGRLAQSQDAEKIKMKLREIVPEYQPGGKVDDVPFRTHPSGYAPSLKQLHA